MIKRRVVIVTGLSGAGKATILRMLEDLGYEAIDNPPLTLLEALTSRTDRPLAIGIDARTRGFNSAEILEAIARIDALGETAVELVYAWADETVLLGRFTESRRRHPLAAQGRVVDGIVAEATLTQLLRDAANLLVDTTGLPIASLRHLIEHRFGKTIIDDSTKRTLTLALVSFAFPKGLPREADMVFDARFLRNPHYEADLRQKTGFDRDVANYVEADADYPAFYAFLLAITLFVLPRFVREGKKYATVAVGCTGGRHRSVTIVERMAFELGAASVTDSPPEWEVIVSHRELLQRGNSSEPGQGG